MSTCVQTNRECLVPFNNIYDIHYQRGVLVYQES